MAASITDGPQLGLMDVLLENVDILRLLHEREKAAEAAKPLSDIYKGLHKQAVGAIGQLALADGEYRCGKYIVNVRTHEGREVSFELGSSTRIGIRVARK